MRSTCLVLFLLAASTLSSDADVNSLFLNGLMFFDSGDFTASARDIRAGDLSPGFDGDFLLTFRDDRRTSFLAGFGILWSRRTEKDDEIPFDAPAKRARIELLGFPFSAGFARRDPRLQGRGWAWGALAHYYFVKFSVDADPSRGDPSWFSLDASGHGERDGGGPALSAFVMYEIPFFLGRAGIGVKGRWAAVRISDESGLSTPEVDLSAVSFFLSAALR